MNNQQTSIQNTTMNYAAAQQEIMAEIGT